MSQFATSRWMTRAILLVLLVLSISPRAFAQNERFPARISVSELEMYRDWMTLSRAQWHATAIAYLDYIREYETLRPEIEKQSDEYVNADTVEEQARRYPEILRGNEVIRRKINEVDDRLFLAIHEMLGEGQLPGWQRTRDHRTRRGYPDFGLSRYPRKCGDLTQVVPRLRLSPEDAAAIEPILIEYESKLTPLVARASNAGWDAGVKLMQEMVRRGFNDSNDREAPWMEVRNETATEWDAIERSIVKLNDATSARLEAALSPAGLDQWRTTYYPLNWEEAGWQWQLRSGVRAALDRLKLGEAEQQVVTERFTRFDKRLDKLLAEEIAAEDSWLREVRTTHRGPERIAEWQAETQKRKAAFKALREEFVAELASVLDDEALPAKLQEAKQEINQESLVASAITLMPRGVRVETLALNQAEFERCCDALELSVDQRAQTAAAFREHRAKVEALAAEFGPPKWEYQADDEAVQRVTKLQSDFFTLIEASIADPAQARLVHLLRAMHARLLVLSQIWYPQGAAAVDVAAMMLDVDAQLLRVDGTPEVLESYDVEAQPLFAQAYAHSRASFDAPPRWRELNDAKVAIARVNLRFLEEALAALPHDDALAVRTAFDRACYPHVVNDGNTAHARLRALLQRDDLLDEQRARAVELLTEYERDYAELTERMLGMVREVVQWHAEADGTMTPSGLGSENGRIVNDDARIYTRLRFQRDELGALARLRAQALLTLEQLERQP